MTQPHFINSILYYFRLDQPDTTTKETPEASSKVLSALLDSEEFDGHFHYCSVIGKLNYLEWCTRMDISYAVHQCARFTEKPKVEHGKAVKWLG